MVSHYGGCYSFGDVKKYDSIIKKEKQNFKEKELQAELKEEEMKK